jgi:hypothetical protein
MEYVQDFDGFGLHSISNNVRKAREYEFASSFFATNSTTIGKIPAANEPTHITLRS